jgi:hypothetical protein
VNDHHSLTLVRVRDVLWRPSCACGWVGTYRRSRHAGAGLYRAHVTASRPRRTTGYKPRPPTPVDQLPATLVPTRR